MLRFALVPKVIVGLITIATALLPLTACEDTGLPRPEPFGKISIQLTDAPGDIKHAVVTISEVYMQGAPSGRLRLSNTPFTVDLTTLANRTIPFLENITIPNGSYTQLRFIVSGAYIEVENNDGSTSIYASDPDYDALPVGVAIDGTLSMSPETVIGAPVTLPNNVLQVLGNERNILVDFDVEESFAATGNALAPWRLNPSLSASDLAVASTVVVAVTLDPGVILPSINGEQLTLADFSAVLTQAPSNSRSRPLTDGNNDGVYTAEFGLLTPGSYTVTMSGPTSIILTTAPQIPVQMTLGASETQTQSIRIIGISVVE